MHASEYLTALDWLARSAVLTLAAFAWHRARRHALSARRDADEARKAERLAWLHTANTLSAEERLTAMLPPDVLPFEPPGESSAPSPVPNPEPEPEPPATLPFPGRPRRGRAPRGGDRA